MTAQMSLPGWELVAPDEPDPLTEARAEYARLRTAWLAVAHIAESAERSRLQPLVRHAAVWVDRLESGGVEKWWYKP